MTLLRVSGAVDEPISFGFADLHALDGQVPDIGALVRGRAGGGVGLRSVLARAGARGGHLLLCAADGFSITVPRVAVEEGLIAYRSGDAPLSSAQGGPLRFFLVAAADCGAGTVDACVNVKGLVEIRVADAPIPDTHHHAPPAP